MKVSQRGLQNSYVRAYNAIYNANLTTIAGGKAHTPAMQAAAKAEADNAVLTQSYLRLEQPISLTNNVIQFPILANSTINNNAQRATEVRLPPQDSFFCSNIAFYIFIAQSAADTALRLQTYPNVNIFPVGAAGLETVAPLNTLYNGYFSVTINKSVILPNYPMSNFLYIPQTQRISTTAGLQSNEFDPSEVSLWEPNINFVGTKESILKINMPANITAIDAYVYGCFILQGTQAQNVTLFS